MTTGKGQVLLGLYHHTSKDCNKDTLLVLAMLVSVILLGKRAVGMGLRRTHL
jgi:hypothetical protein